MITTVTLNASVEKTCFLGNVHIGQGNRVPVMHSTPGGKGINAARAAHLLGCPVLTTGFIAGFNGSYIETELSKEGILHEFMRVEGESRVNLNILDGYSGMTKEVLEKGPVIASDDVLAVKDKIKQLADYSVVIAVGGSLPKGAPTNLYADFIEIAHHEGALTVLDAGGEELRAGIEAKPFFVKLSEQALAAYLDKTHVNDADLHDGIRLLLHKGITCPAVSLGNRGAMVGYEEKLYRIYAPDIVPVNVLGCGDSFVGGFMAGLYKREPMEECFRLAVAAGTANALTEESGNIRLNDVKSLLGQIKIEAIP